MKLFNVIIALSLFVIAGGFLFFKNGFASVKSKPLEESQLRKDMLNYLDYSEAVLANAQLRGKSILFFAATRWCHTCSDLDKEIQTRISELPGNVTILKVDYDNDTAMNNKWNVTSQHTLVVLDEQGQEITRWLGGGFDTLLQHLEQM